MLQKRKRFLTITIFVSLSFILLISYLLLTEDPVKIIENKINLKLPSSSKVVKFNYGFLRENFKAKVQINEEDIETIRKILLDYFKVERIIENKDKIPNFNNTTSWWDMDKENVVNCYSKLVSGKKVLFFPAPKTEPIWAFIVKQDDDLYYLYISHR